jgi:hypothetical protein
VSQVTVQNPDPAVQSNRNIIFQLEGFMKNELPESAKIDVPVKHHFARGAYAREMLIPAGSLIVGKIHKHAHLNVIAFGKIEVATDEKIWVIDGPYPYIFTSPPGVKRVVLAITDTSWTTFHVTNETDLEAIEKETIAESYEEIPLLEGKQP